MACRWASARVMAIRKRHLFGITQTLGRFWVDQRISIPLQLNAGQGQRWRHSRINELERSPSLDSIMVPRQPIIDINGKRSRRANPQAE